MKRVVTLTNGEIEFILDYINGDSYCFKKENNKVPSKVAWAMFNNRKALIDAKTKIDEFRTEINNSYIDDEHSYVTKNENGEDVRRVKDEYFNDYSNELEGLRRQRTDVTFSTISLKDIEDCSMDDIDYTYISYLLEENDDYVGPGHNDGAEDAISVEVVDEN